MSKAYQQNALESFRIHINGYPRITNEFSGAYCIPLTMRKLQIVRSCKVIASDEGGWRHVSVSILDSSSPPSWEMMSEAKDLFWSPDEWVIQFHPARSEYVNIHPGCLHLWQPWDGEKPIQFPTPPRYFV